MSTIDRNTPATGPLKRLEATPPAPAAKKKAPTDALNISVNARVKLNDQHKPEAVLESVAVEGGDVQGQVEKQMKGRRAGLRGQVTRQVVEAIADQVAAALAPVLKAQLAQALAAEHLPPELAEDLAAKTVPEITRIISAELADQVTVTRR